MTFLNPFALFGLLAAAIPILIHLLNIRKLKVVDFSSLRFLKELQKTRMRRLKMRQWLVLLLRTMLVAFLVLAFSRPALRGTFAAFGEKHAASTIVILLDDSPTMGMRNDHGVLFQQTKDAVASLMTTATGPDEVYLLRLSEIRDLPDHVLPAVPASVAKALNGMNVSQQSRPYLSLVARGLQILSASRNANKELYLITDGQGSEFSLADTAHVAGMPESGTVNLFVVEVPPAQRENAAVVSLVLESRLLSAQRPIQLRGTVRNFGERTISNTLASLYLDGVRVAQQSISIAPHSTTSLSLSAIPRRRGALGVSLHIDDDAFPLDNDYYHVVRIPDQIAVVCAGQSAADTRFPAAVLAAAQDSSQAGTFTIQQLTQSRLQPPLIRAADVLVISNIGILTTEQSAAIAAEVRAGKGLIIFPGKETDYTSLNAGLLVSLGIPPLVPADLRQLATDRTGFLSFSAVEYKHPVFEGMFVQESGKTGASPSIQSPQIRTAAGLQVGTTGYPVITMTNGAPFLCEYSAGKGKILVFAVECGITWSDFPFKGVFAPLLHRSTLYLASQHDAIGDATVGDRLRFPLKQTAGEAQEAIVVKSPSGAEERVQPERHVASTTALYQSSSSQETGIYTLTTAGGASAKSAPLQAISVNSAPLESDLSRFTTDGFNAFLKRTGIAPDRTRMMQMPADIQHIVTESRYGTELWRYFLILAILCALAEMALSRATQSTTATEEHASRDH
jgi:hypothetical protein